MPKPTLPKETWKDKPFPHTVGNFEFAYRDIPQSVYEWVDPTRYFPLPFDMCELKTEEKIRKGWWTGHKWESLRLKTDEKVHFWRKKREE